tara:strand:+ start:6830 stop:7723 length:894 start_codon:yes stop_codon:yes gene_type:complete
MRAANFFCLGSPKSGTTSIFYILSQHSQIFQPKFKEPLFFNDNKNFHKGFSWYSKEYFRKVKKEKWILDFTPSYLYSSKALTRLKEYSNFLPIKFLIILRHPVERAYSHYLHTQRDGFENLQFSDALQDEKNRLSKHKSNLLNLLKFSYVDHSLYFKYLNKYLSCFHKKQFFIINYESQILNQKTFKKTINDLQNFLEINVEPLNIDIYENTAKKSKYSVLQTLLNSKGLHKKIAKYLIPSKIGRQLLTNRIRKFNEKKIIKKNLDEDLKKNLYRQYFEEDVLKLESLLKRKMNWND